MPATPTPADDAAVAAQLATEAGELLLDLRADSDPDEVAEDPKQLGTRGDAAAHELLMARLEELRPTDAVLSEEGVASGRHPERLSASRVWIIDPLDGTREFGEVPRTDWAVHVALAIDGTASVGAVALPAQSQVLTSTPPAQLPPPSGKPPRVVVSRSRPPAAAEEVADVLGGELIPMGSAGAKTMAVLLGDADAYVHAGGQYEWDSAAPVAVAAAAGLHTSRLDGSPLVYNQPDPYLPDLLVCRPELAEAVLAAVAAAAGQS